MLFSFIFDVIGDMGDWATVVTLFSLYISKLGVLLNIDMDFGVADVVFGWLADVSVIDIVLPNVPNDATSSAQFAFVITVGPALFARSFYLDLIAKDREYGVHNSTIIEKYGVHLLVACFIIILSVGLATLNWYVVLHGIVFLGIPAAYLIAVMVARNLYFRYLETAYGTCEKDIGKPIEVEARFVVLVFVMAYSFVMNSLLITASGWSDFNAGQRAGVVIALLLYGIIPLLLLAFIISLIDYSSPTINGAQGLSEHFRIECKQFEVFLLLESVVISLIIILAGGDIKVKMIATSVFTVACASYTMWLQPFDSKRDMITDFVGRLSAFINFVSVALIDTGDLSANAGNVILLVSSSMACLWFIFNFDFMDLFATVAELLGKARSARKKIQYTTSNIKKLNDKDCVSVLSSDVEMSFLTNYQVNQFLNFHRDVMFSAEVIQSCDTPNIYTFFSLAVSSNNWAAVIKMWQLRRSDLLSSIENALKRMVEKGYITEFAEVLPTTDVCLVIWCCEEDHDEALVVSLNAGRSPHAVSSDHTPAILVASKLSRTKIVDILLRHGADVKCVDKGGANALMYAARWGSSNNVSYLIDHGADINATDECGSTALMHAASGRGSEVIPFLIDQGADVKAVSKCGDIAIMYAVKEGNLGAVEALVQYGVPLEAFTIAKNRYGELHADIAKLDDWIDNEHKRKEILTSQAGVWESILQVLNTGPTVNTMV